MEDQVDGLKERDLNFATFINSNLRPAERRERLEQLYDGEKDLLYISAEQLRSPSIRALLQQRLPSLIVFDEAHCISQWGHDFRPDYRYAPKFIREIYCNQQQLLPLMAFMTATATIAVRQDIKSLFAKHQILIHAEICSSSKRENLEYQIIPTSKQAKDGILIAKVKQALATGGAVLVYTATRKDAARLAQMLKDNQIEARCYHSKISKHDKQEILRKFKDKELNVVVATCAFGMGIDRSDVRAVIHHAMSSNLEGYVQEVGRAGRDGKPSVCTLLFDPQDAETAFLLQSLNQLSEMELYNLFLAVRQLRDKIFDKASEEFFWVTTNEIFQTSDLDNEFASEISQRDTKIKVALYYLESFDLIEREENQSSLIKFELVHSTSQGSLEAFDLYAHKNNLPIYRKDEFQKLILAMHLAKSYCQSQDEPYSLEKLSDSSGIAMEEIRRYIKELERSGICTSKITTSILITKVDRGNRRNDARVKYEKHRTLEEHIIEEILTLMGDRQEIQINCRALTTRLDPDRQQKLTSRMILEILEGWSFLKWIRYKKVRHDVVRIIDFSAVENFENHHRLIDVIIDLLYKMLGEKTGQNLRLSLDSTFILSEINKVACPQVWELEDLERAWIWMHRNELIRLDDGSNLFCQFLKIRVTKGAQKDKIIREYPKKVKPYYEEQFRRTHIMLAYGNQHKQENADLQQYIEEYFSLSGSEFSSKYLNMDIPAAKLPITQADYNRIIESLNPAQREIVLSESPAISVIAGPGSGKTRTIVHRIAYLVKVKRVDPARIIALAYNRNAVRELRLRLQALVGEMASRLRVYTFHGLSLAILGRTVDPIRDRSESTLGNVQDPNEKFIQLIKSACDFLEQSDENIEDLKDEDRQFNISKILGNCEYIFVDEYQDVAEHEYRLVKLIAGLQESEDQSRSVQANICVIGDDDQNIYEWRGTSTQYIQSFQAEYQAKQYLLVENYRSTEPIIAASNRLIQNNKNRLKKRGDQQAKIDNTRFGQSGLDVHSLKFEDDDYQAEYIKRQVKKWIECDGVQRGEIAILARNWQYMDKTRALLERRAGIPTYSLKGEGVKLVHNQVTQLLISALEKNPNLILSKEDSVKSRFESFFERNHFSLSEPTVKILVKIAEDIDKERGYGSENLSTQVAVSEIITAIYEFNESPDVSVDLNAVLVTSCHGAKGLEFKYVILIADGFDYRQDRIESERRLFYVAMTRAKEKLILTHSQDSRFVQEAGAMSYPMEKLSIVPPQFVFYADLTPKDVHLGCYDSKQNQKIIKQLREGDFLDLRVGASGKSWLICFNDLVIGQLSKQAVGHLEKRGIYPGDFVFQSGEVAVRNVYRYVKTNEISGEVMDAWYVVIPQIRICR
jgi:ATP-dependent DNA helicase RecQ